jgi:hypothetical protein
MSSPNLIASIRQRLRNKATQTDEVFDFVLARYAVERLLYRLSVSNLSNQFVLKGALLFYLWNEQMHRPTRDLDLLGFGPADAATLEQTFKQIISTSVPDDGLTFFPDTITAEPIREDDLYGGIRVKLMAKLGNIRIPLQIDVGFGDAVTPGPESSRFPTLLTDLPTPAIRSYPVYTVIAEKLEAMVSLGDRNSRLKDFFDLRFILQTEQLDPAVLSQAIKSTFERRKTPLPTAVPRCLTPEFAAVKETLWKAFLDRNGLTSKEESFAEVLQSIRTLLPYKWQPKS